jgi:thiol-disulfide isomerase/thioredoxin
MPTGGLSAVTILIVSWACLLLFPIAAHAQQGKATSSADDLVKSIGMSKPALTKAPDFSLRDANGGPVSLSGRRGNLIFVNFWATWCEPCREEMPSMEQLSRNFGGQGFTILAINQREGAAQVTRFMKMHGLNFTAPLDLNGRVAQSYRVYGIPVSYLIDDNGNAIGMKSGTRDWAARDVVDAFRKLIGERSGASTIGTMDLEPALPLASALRAKGSGLSVRSQQDANAEAVAKVARDEEIVPLGKASGAGEHWYMVRTKSGAVGWVRGSEVEEVRSGK